jgi:hypothetical protein
MPNDVHISKAPAVVTIVFLHPATRDSRPAESALTDLGAKAILRPCLMPSPGMVALGHHT